MQVFSTKTNKPHLYPFLRPHDDWHGYVDFEPIEFSISNDGKTWHSIYDQPDLDGVLCYSHQPAVANQANEYKKLGLNDGQVLVSSSYDQRELKMNIHFVGMNENDMYLAMDALQQFLDTRSPIWICWEDWPQRMYYVKAKLGDPNYLSDQGWTCEVTLTDLIGLSRSVGTTGDNENMVKGFGNNLPVEAPTYSFTTNNFTVQNTSNILIDPERRGHPLTITFEGSSGGNMKITNKTTGDSFTYKKAFNGKFVLDGVNPEVNGNDCLADTDYGVITLQIGKNEFQVDNFSGTVTFDFAMWWLS